MKAISYLAVAALIVCATFTAGAWAQAAFGQDVHGGAMFGGMTTEQWYGFVCGSDGLVLRWFVHLCTWVFGPIGVGAILANSKTLQKIPGFNVVLNYVGANWAGWIREAAARAAAQPAPAPSAQPQANIYPPLQQEKKP